MEVVQAELMSPPANIVVLRLAGREEPGLFIQGDTLSTLDADDLAEIRVQPTTPAERHEVEVLSEGDVTVLRLPWRRFPGVLVHGELTANDLPRILARYAATLAEHGIPLPYTP